MAVASRQMVARIAPALRRWETWVAAAVVLFLGTLAYYMIAGLLTPVAPSQSSQQIMIMRGIKGQAERAGKLGWRFTADSTNASADGSVTTYYRTVATYYDSGKARFRMTAPQVEVDSRSANYTAQGGVHVWSLGRAPGQDFKTLYVVWSQASQLLSCPNEVRLIDRGTTLVTSHMNVNLRTGDTQLGRTTIVSR